MGFNYFYNRDGDKFNFIRVPQVFFEDDIFKNLSSDAKLLYSILLARIGLSYKNGWVDECGRVFIIFTLKEIMEKMNCAKSSAVKILDELDAKKGIGLIERKRLGLGKPNIIYVKDFLNTEVQNREVKYRSSK